MYKIIGLLLCFATFVVSHNADEIALREKRMVGGDRTNFRENPHVALLRVVKRKSVVSRKHKWSSCTGVIIHKNWILTSARCVDENSIMAIFVNTGDLNSGESKSIFVKSHEKYNFGDPEAKLYDVGLLQMERSLDFNEFQQPIPLANSEDVIRVNQSVRITGFGVEDVKDNGSSKPEHFNTIEQKLIWPDECKTIEEGHSRNELYSNPKLLCAKSQKGRLCLGDSGSPAESGGKLIGIVTHKSANCESSSDENPTIYTNIREYFQWILENTGEDASDIKKLSYSVKL